MTMRYDSISHVGQFHYTLFSEKINKYILVK
ncbi:hypothetical protein DJ46_5730 (plasmid) [Bacillus anthracis str. Vollum]|nr:hypothetical protein DJ44_5653 [Bacillus anthracis]AIK60848.1 hypothetical protein DJ46_5730 [Bacillus anthracis str. Vollum]AJG50986.1 hypothetical protein AS53_5714 [Bacillus anthracis str. Turkey32]AJH43124.1 hypothetical protein AW20_5708 [Bacillus anthracis str. Sterne]AJH97077.1 hypothetical protein AK39_5660 [Bacillus anthracis str. V770-NP-1R]